MEEIYHYFATIFSFPPRVKHDAVRRALELIAQTTPGVKPDMNVDKFLDESILDELEREGFFKRF